LISSHACDIFTPFSFWFVLVGSESNPDLMNQYAAQLGLIGDSYQFHDILGIDPELLDMVPQPAIAVLLLFPFSDACVVHREQERQRLEKDGQVVDPSVYFCKQTVGNACGTIAIIHALMNCRDKLQLDSDKFLAKFLTETASMSPEQRADALGKDDSIEAEHQALAEQGQSQVLRSVAV
jgi:ubiquitin carboxyl-terminal hydrolase L3